MLRSLCLTDTEEGFDFHLEMHHTVRKGGRSEKGWGVWVIGWSVGWLVGWLAGWLVGWLAGLL
jgi:hypothetical protein